MKNILIVLNVVVGVLAVGMTVLSYQFFTGLVMSGCDDGPTSIICYRPLTTSGFVAPCIFIAMSVLPVLLFFANAVMLYRLGKKKI